MSWPVLLRRPSGFVPVIFSLAALATVLGHLALFGAERSADEGSAAHIFQGLMVAQVPIVAFFAFRWLPKFRREALPVLVLQVAAALVALAPVFFLGL